MGPARLGDGYRIRVTVARCCSRRRLRTVLVNLRSLEHVRAARLINLVMLLQRQEVVTAAYLARELDVTPRTIARDMVELADAGIRVEPVRGRTGGYRLSQDLRLRLGGLAREEVEALFLSGVPEAVRALGLSRASAAARLKLGTALAPALRGAPSKVEHRFHLDAPGWFREIDTPPPLTDLARGVWNDHLVTLDYRGGHRPGAAPPPVVSRTVQPYGLVLKAGVWYLVARVDETFRTYRLDRIIRWRLETETFRRIRDVDLGSVWRSASHRFGASILTETVTIRLTHDGAARLRHVVSPHAWEMVRADVVDAEPPVTLRLPVESTEVAVAELIRLGADVEILEPKSAREQMVSLVARMAAVYLD